MITFIIVSMFSHPRHSYCSQMSPKMQTGILLLLLHASFLVTPSSSAAPELANAAGTANTTANRTQLSSWAGNIVNTVNNILESARNQTAGANSSASLSAISDMMSRVPGILKGLEGVDFGGNDVGRTLASLFGDPRCVCVGVCVCVRACVRACVCVCVCVGVVSSSWMFCVHF